jgi:hypothetical protein
MTNGDGQESCLKPIGAMAQLIEALPMNNFFQLMVNLSKLSAQEEAERHASTVTIGLND